MTDRHSVSQPVRPRPPSPWAGNCSDSLGRTALLSRQIEHHPSVEVPMLDPVAILLGMQFSRATIAGYRRKAGSFEPWPCRRRGFRRSCSMTSSAQTAAGAPRRHVLRGKLRVASNPVRHRAVGMPASWQTERKRGRRQVPRTDAATAPVTSAPRVSCGSSTPIARSSEGSAIRGTLEPFPGGSSPSWTPVCTGVVAWQQPYRRGVANGRGGVAPPYRGATTRHTRHRRGDAVQERGDTPATSGRDAGFF